MTNHTLLAEVSVAAVGATAATIGQYTYQLSVVEGDAAEERKEEEEEEASETRQKIKQQQHLRLALVKKTSSQAENYADMRRRLVDELEKHTAALVSCKKKVPALQRLIVEGDKDEDCALHVTELSELLIAMRQHTIRKRQLEDTTSLQIEYTEEKVETSIVLPPYEQVELPEVLEGVLVMWCPPHRYAAPKQRMEESRREVKESSKQMEITLVHHPHDEKQHKEEEVENKPEVEQQHREFPTNEQIDKLISILEYSSVPVPPNGGLQEEEEETLATQGGDEELEVWNEPVPNMRVWNCASVPWGGGAVLITDTGNNQVHVMSRLGVLQKSFGFVSNPVGAVVVAVDRLFVTDSGRHRVSEWTLDGVYVSSFGSCSSSESAKEADGGDLFNPQGIAANNAYLFVADFGNHRVQVFDHEGGYVREFAQTNKCLLPVRVAASAFGSEVAVWGYVTGKPSPVRIYNGNDGTLLREIEVGDNYVDGLSICGDNDQLLVLARTIAGHLQLKVYSLTSGMLQRCKDLGQEPIGVVCMTKTPSDYGKTNSVRIISIPSAAD